MHRPARTGTSYQRRERTRWTGASILAIAALVLTVGSSARQAFASCAQFTAFDQGLQNTVSGTVNGNAETFFYAGDFKIRIDGGPETTSYCVDLQHNIFLNDTVCQVNPPTYPAQNACAVVYILNNAYPVANNIVPGGALTPAAREAAAVQVAIWTLTDPFVATSPSDVVQRAADIVADAQNHCATLPPVPQTINMSPSTDTNFLPDQTSHSVTATVLDTNSNPVANEAIQVTVTGISGPQTFNGTTNASGQFLVNYSNGFAQPGSDTITATVNFTVPTGLEFKSNDKQGIVLAGPPQPGSVTGTAHKTWVSNTCGDGFVSSASGEECDDGNQTNGDGCDNNCTTSRCGNGIKAPNEQCDDGNTMAGDGCSANCTIEVCGNGIVDPGEQCDDGNHVNGDACDNNCTTPRCGNGIQDPGEECDDANQVNGDACDNNCTLPRCGNGIQDPGEQCDEGALNGTPGHCEANCTQPKCGNGVMDSGEQCDDGNLVDGDGCEHDCTLPRCGNGIMDAGEQCDDGNLVDGDGCEHDCKLAVCGNGILDMNLGEQCDHGALNGTPNDACTAQCKLHEICGNLVDDDGNGLIDCDDPVCPCEPFERDPAQIRPRGPKAPTKYFFKAFGRIDPLTDIDPEHEGFGVVLTDSQGIVYTATLGPGLMQPTKLGSRRWRFNDRNAKKGTSTHFGLSKVQIDPHYGGYKVEIDAYGDFSKAEAEMTLQFVVGNDEFFNKATWTPTKNGGWKVHVN